MSIRCATVLFSHTLTSSLSDEYGDDDGGQGAADDHQLVEEEEEEGDEELCDPIPLNKIIGGGEQRCSEEAEGET